VRNSVAESSAPWPLWVGHKIYEEFLLLIP
jgi:hypothetical protein